MASTSDNLQRTPLYSEHVTLGAKLVPFGGWEMPVQYSGILDEHQAVRQRVGLFDISHMGEFMVSGPTAESALNRLLTNDVRKLGIGQGQYSLLCNPSGGIIDDLILYRVEPSVYLIVVNAANIAADFAWISEQAGPGVIVEDQSPRSGALALQGPLAKTFLENSAKLPPFHIEREAVFGCISWVARTGYTGEDGFEIICAAADTRELWNDLLEFGAEFEIKPCGLGCRDTLRLEACLPLHGNDISVLTTPVEAGLTRFVAFDKGDFVGRGTLLDQQKNGVARKLVAFKMAAVEKCPPPRSHYAIWADGRKVGEVTSGTQSPTLGCGIGMGYVATNYAAVGTTIEIEIRGKMFPATIEKKPLYKRKQ